MLWWRATAMPRDLRGVQSVGAEGFGWGTGNGERGTEGPQSGSFAMILSVCITPKRPWGGHLGYRPPSQADQTGPEKRIGPRGIDPDQPLDPGPGQGCSAWTPHHAGGAEGEDGSPQSMEDDLPRDASGKPRRGQHKRISRQDRRGPPIPPPKRLRKRALGGRPRLRVRQDAPSQIRLPGRKGETGRADNCQDPKGCHGQQQRESLSIHGRPRRETASIALSGWLPPSPVIPTPPSRAVSPRTCTTTCATAEPDAGMA